MLAWRIGAGERAPPIRGPGMGHVGAAEDEPERPGFDLSGVLAVPGHDGVLPDGWSGNGGARGWAPRWKISMTTMRPPQQGQGGGEYGSGAISSFSLGAGAASNSLVRVRLLSRPAPASRP